MGTYLKKSQRLKNNPCKVCGTEQSLYGVLRDGNMIYPVWRCGVCKEKRLGEGYVATYATKNCPPPNSNQA
jgi:ribosomal protein L37AE/L43A